MKLPRKQAAVVQEAIARWKQDGVIPEAQAATLAGTIEVQYFDSAEVGQVLVLDCALLDHFVGQCGALRSDASRFARSYLQGPSLA